VKLINGNETNILIPQNWMKKYLEDQEQGLDQQEPGLKHTVEIQSMNFIFFNNFIIFLFFLKRMKLRKLLQQSQHDLEYCLRQA